uniref:Uncharacterized protein n=1 Tax=Rhizophora mucronata TaxID=61149 RepID=A0A2P2NQE0_RHIMU
MAQHRVQQRTIAL